MSKNLSKILYALWIYTLMVIAWGAWVRISHSGNGCGDHWPLCNGEVIPDFTDKKTITEYAHRITSGLYGLFVFYIFYFLRKNSKFYSPLTQKLNRALLIFMIIEALLGALLVKQNLVTVNDSIYRLFVMSLHQLNSLLLAGTVYLLHLSVHKTTSSFLKLKWTPLIVSFLVVASSGAIAALASTLFPSVSLWEGIVKDFSSDSHLFIKLRALHPFLAISIVGFAAYYLSVKRNENVLAFKLLVAALVGVITLLTLSPIWLKITHLILAHYLWVEILRYQLIGKQQTV